MQLNTDISVELLHYSSTHSLFTDVDLSYHNLLLALCSMSSWNVLLSEFQRDAQRHGEKKDIISQISDVLQIELKELLFLKYKNLSEKL